MTALQEDLDFLAHFGKKGMKWGKRKAKQDQARIAAREKGDREHLKTIKDPADRAEFKLLMKEARQLDKEKPGWDKPPKMKRKITDGQKAVASALFAFGGLSLINVMAKNLGANYARRS